MSGLRRLFREGNSTPLVRGSKLNFGLIAMLLLTALAIVITWTFPDIQLQFLAGL